MIVYAMQEGTISISASVMSATVTQNVSAEIVTTHIVQIRTIRTATTTLGTTVAVVEVRDARYNSNVS